MNIKIKSGDLFSFTTVEENRYGLIQVISKGKIGVNVRVFYNVFTDLSNDKVHLILENEGFYYLKDFYEYDLLKKSQSYLGNYKIPIKVKMPKYMRVSERKLNGTLIWYIVDTKTSKITKTFNVFDDELRDLSPAKTWGIDYIRKRWEDKFTLKTWDSYMEDKWYRDYLIKYDPSKRIEQQKVTISKIRDSKPTIIWKKNIEHHLNISNLSESVIEEIDKLLDEYLEEIEKCNSETLNEITNSLIINLNEINNKNHCIETEESEQLLEFITKVQQFLGFNKGSEDYSSIRSW